MVIESTCSCLSVPVLLFILLLKYIFLLWCRLLRLRTQRRRERLETVSLPVTARILWRTPRMRNNPSIHHRYSISPCSIGRVCKSGQRKLTLNGTLYLSLFFCQQWCRKNVFCQFVRRSLLDSQPKYVNFWRLFFCTTVVKVWNYISKVVYLKILLKNRSSLTFVRLFFIYCHVTNINIASLTKYTCCDVVGIASRLPEVARRSCSQSRHCTWRTTCKQQWHSHGK